MTSRAPRYDIPNAAPDPLRLVQQFVNTVNYESKDDWLASWLGGQGVSPSGDDLDRARVVREAIRELLYANNRQHVDGEPWRVLSAAADAAALSIDFSRPEMSPRAAGLDGAVGRVLVVSYTAMTNGTWGRLKACRNCRWAFYDYSKNRSASWCSMQLCGNRTKTRAYRARRTAER